MHKRMRAALEFVAHWLANSRRWLNRYVPRRKRKLAPRIVPERPVSREVKEDLAKPYEQLLDDVYDEILRQETQQDALLHGFKRACALFAKMGLDSRRAQRDIRLMTLWIWVYTMLMAALVYFQSKLYDPFVFLGLVGLIVLLVATRSRWVD